MDQEVKDALIKLINNLNRLIEELQQIIAEERKNKGK
jgi:hypothetical protein